MKATRDRVWHIKQQWRLFLVILAIVFMVEATIMFCLPVILPNASFVGEAVFDALLLTVVVAPLFWRLIIRPMRELAEARAQLWARVLTAQEEERGRIARDLHDGLGQLLTCLTVGLRTVEETTSDEAIRGEVQELRRIGGQTHQEIRRIAAGLRPSVLDDLGLAAALKRYFEDLEKSQKIRSQLELASLEQSRLPAPIETALYRIIQEATSNAIRHGEASELRLTTRRDADHVELTLRDNGRGFHPPSAFRSNSESRSFGLRSMRERVALFAGTLNIDSQPGQGTVVTVRIPLPSEP